MRGQTEGSHEEINVEEAIRIHGNMVYRLALVQMKNKSEAEDVFQEVFLRLVKYKERIQGREHLKAWLLRVTVNCCKKQFDSAFRKKTVSIDRDVQSTDSYEMDLRRISYMRQFFACRQITGVQYICFTMNNILFLRLLRCWNFRSRL